VSQELADNARKFAGELFELLEQEFEALKAQDLNSLELLQERKTSLLNYLSSESIKKNVLSGNPSKEWIPFKTLMIQCKESHRRNEILVTRRLDSIKSALNTLTGQNKEEELEMYDRLGKISQKKNSKGILEA
jgi:flagellar biosynthesis/type III secretory pathway chaperone